MIRTRTPTVQAAFIPADRGLVVQGIGFLGLLCAVAILTLGACTQPLGGTALSSETRSDAATRDACRRRANEIYDRQNRATIFAPNSGLNSPSSGAYVAGQTDRGLSAQFAQEQLIRECVRNASGAAEASPVAPSPQAPAAAPKR